MLQPLLLDNAVGLAELYSLYSRILVATVRAPLKHFIAVMQSFLYKS